jgi:hypothetical protein
MEEFLIFLLQFLFEVVAQFLCELPWDWFVGSREWRLEAPSGSWEWACTSFLIGTGFGIISLALRPTTAIHSAAGRIAYLLLAAPISGLLSRWFAAVIRDCGRAWIDPRRHAVCAFSFTLAMTLIRFAYAHRV